jgi:hypothetical protein
MTDDVEDGVIIVAAVRLLGPGTSADVSQEEAALQHCAISRRLLQTESSPLLLVPWAGCC